jgi:16S rRNA (guanine527-N7)-methyltransferase
LSNLPFNHASPECIFKTGMGRLSLDCSEQQVHLFMIYLSELKKWNNVYSLTALQTDADIIEKHFLDSLLYLCAIPDGNVRIADIGSGAGFPGIPVKIIRPESIMHLIEPSRKKASFLRHMVKILQLEDVEVIEKRVEEIDHRDLGVALSRALFSIRDFVKKASPFLRENGRMILSKGPKVYEELRKAGIEDLNYEVRSLKLPFTGAKRFLLVAYKSAPRLT